MSENGTAQVEQMPVLGRCKQPGCDYALWSAPEDIRQAGNLNDVVPGAAFRMTDKGNLLARCPNRHKVFRLHTVEGEFDPDVKCDGRCEGARGNVCRCACGGMNHGRGHAKHVENVSVLAGPEREEQRQYEHANAPTDAQIAFITTLIHERDVLPPHAATPEALDELVERARSMERGQVSEWIDKLKAAPKLATRPLEAQDDERQVTDSEAEQEALEATYNRMEKLFGEVGEQITGKALVTHEQDVNDATLYLFRAQVDGWFGTIKWFKPSYINVDFAKGDSIDFKAKVKRHETERGNCTLVTYLEQVA